ncbi:MAG TPA: histidine kinase [Acidothermaceae bacterium]|nr:histidine kinase [Acidothermaceae bacterium]
MSRAAPQFSTAPQLRAAQWITAAARRYRDVALAVALCAGGEYELFAHVTYSGAAVWPGPRAVNAILIPFLTLPLVARRKRPLAVCLSVFGLLALSSLVLGGGEATTEFLLFIATTFTGAAYTSRPVVIAAAALAAGVVHDLRDPQVHGFSDAVWSLGLLAISFLLGRAVYARQHRIGSLEHAAVVAERRHADEVAAATAAERAAIARELHDIVAHAVSVIVIQAQAGSRALPTRIDVAADVLTTIESSARTALAELRRLLTLLSDDGDPATTNPVASLSQLPELLDRCRGAGLAVELDADQLPTLTPASDLAAYRVIQEALTNTLRHAPGAAAAVTVRRRRESIELVVTDNGGDGSAAASATDGTQRGLIGMRERLALVGGELVKAGPSASGYIVEAVIPVEPARTDDVDGRERELAL